MLENLASNVLAISNPRFDRSTNQWVEGITSVWNVASGQKIGSLPKFVKLSFSPDGKYLATKDKENSTVRVWLLRPKDLIAEACSRLTRNLTEEEWKQYLPDESYRPTCPNLPIPEK